MFLSKYFIPIVKDHSSSSETLLSHKLMLRAGMIRQVSSGIYNLLPISVIILRKISNIVREEMSKIDCLEVIMPNIQSANLWIESKRYDDYGKEMLRIKDRHNNDLLYGPTHEELISDLFRKNIFSYKELPKSFFQINNKFRDEIRPRFGLMRAREFIMKDAYSFDISEEEARKTYNKFYDIYLDIFTKIGIKPAVVQADNGAIGGDLSHEFHILSNNGESEIYYDNKYDSLINKLTDLILNNKDNNNNDQISKMKNEIKDIYMVAKEKYNKDNLAIDAKNIIKKKGIEIGHIFYFGDKYTKNMDIYLTDKNDNKFYPKMGSYGIGVSRLMAGAIEHFSKEDQIILPDNIAPFNIAIINLSTRNDKANDLSLSLYHKLKSLNYDILYDDRNISVGKKFKDMKLIGTRHQIIIGSNNLEKNIIEYQDIINNIKKEINIENNCDDLIKYLIKIIKNK